VTLVAASHGVIADIAVAGLLIVGVALVLLSCAGVAAFESAYDRLHFAAAAGFGAAAVAAAVVVREHFSLIGNKAVFVAAFLLLTSPVVAHATARAVRIREHGGWMPQPDEDIPVEER
jgi:multicomponent Na+:H+ antiporter subunit G